MGPVFHVSAYDGVLSRLCGNEFAGVADNGRVERTPFEKWV